MAQRQARTSNMSRGRLQLRRARLQKIAPAPLVAQTQ
jgi:hypothetical protein